MKDIVIDMKLTISLLKNLRTMVLSSLVIHLMDYYLKFVELKDHPWFAAISS